MRPAFKERFFFSLTGLYFIVVCYLGFSATVSMKLETAPIPTYLVIHGVVFSLWLTLYLIQCLLIDSGRRDLHKLLGKLSAVVLPAVLLVGAYAVLSRDPSRPGYYSTIGFNLVLLCGGVVTASIGLLNRRRPFVHKRLMFFASFILSTPGITRVHFYFDSPRPLLTGLVLMLIPLLALNAYDFARTRRVYSLNIALFIGFFVIVFGSGLPFLWNSSVWHGMVDTLAALVALRS